MRAFGIFAAFAAITSAFAAPLSAPANAVAARNDDAASVTINISNTIVTLNNVVSGTIVPQIQTIITTVDNVQDVATQVKPLLIQLATVISTAIVKVGGNAVSNALDIGDNTQSTGTLTVEQIQQILAGLQALIADILCKVVALLNGVDPELATIVTNVLTCIAWLLKAVQYIVGDLSLDPLGKLVASILSVYNISIPGVN